MKLTKGERRIILDRLYDRFVSLGDLYNNPLTERSDKRRLRTERRALAALINKLEGTTAIDIETAL